VAVAGLRLEPCSRDGENEPPVNELIDGRLRKDKKVFARLAWGGSLSVRCTSFVWFVT
jgi:hypothetical protein